MAVCKYFLQGNCRYGNSCWNEHPSGGNQGYSVSAQRQLFGGNKRGGGGGGGGSGQRVSFRDSFGQNQNPYRWFNQDAQQQKSTLASAQTLSSAEVMKTLASEVTTTLEGGKMWPFTCIAFDKDMPNLPGFEDVSPEELRLEAYEALKGGNIQEYVQKVEGALNQVVTQRQELKNPNLTLKQKLISFIDDCKKKKNSGTGGHVSLFSESNTGGGLFGSGSNTESGGLFGQPASQGFGQNGSQSLFTSSSLQTGLFGQSTNQSGPFGQSTQQSGFGSQSTSAQTGLFGKSTTQTGSLFGPEAFAQKQSFSEATFTQPTQPQLGSEQQTIFGQPLPQSGQNSDTIFGQPVPTGGLFGKNPPQTPTNPFGSTSFSTPQSSGATSGNIFQTSTPFGQSSLPAANLFGKPSAPVTPITAHSSHASGATSGETTGQTSDGNSVYTPMDKLTAQEIEQFRAQVFTLGSIPTKPPPRELCF